MVMDKMHARARYAVFNCLVISWIVADWSYLGDRALP
jgi:hypothetical protein